jgi:hypothetical protein
MTINPTEFRKNIYKLLDQVLNTGVPIEIERKGKRIKIVPEKKMNKLDNLKRRKLFNCDPNGIVHIDWSTEWKI